MEKKDVRKKILKERRAMNEQDVKMMSHEICLKIRTSILYENADDICLYMPVNNEVDVPQIIDAAVEDGKRLWLPRVDGENMDFFRYDENTNLVKGSFNIMEPDSDEKLYPDSRTLVVMPGAVFSETKDRIGYGGGFYDRYLNANTQCRTMAVCYDFQILEEIPSEEHDKKPDVIISEKRIMV